MAMNERASQTSVGLIAWLVGSGFGWLPTHLAKWMAADWLSGWAGWVGQLLDFFNCYIFYLFLIQKLAFCMRLS